MTKRYTLKTVLEKITGTPIDKLDSIPDFYTVFSSYFTASTDPYWTTGTGKALWENIYRRHYGDIIFAEKKDLTTSQDFLDAAGFFVWNFYSIYADNHDYYDKLIELYESKKSHLLDKLTRETHAGTLGSDTPQDYDIEQYLNDKHASTASLSHATEEYDNEDAITKLDKIQRLYKDALSAYVRKFDELFISSLNYSEAEYE